MSHDFHYTYKCPHCGAKQTRYCPTEDSGLPHVVYCDVEGGGCDRMLVVKVDLVPTVTVWKVEDQAPPKDGNQEPAADEYPPPCTNPGGHVWNRSAGEADEARLSGDYANDNIRCVYCGADGDA